MDKKNLFFIIKNSNLIDYLGYFWVFLLFVIIFIFSIYLINKFSWIIGALFILLDFVLLFFGFYMSNNLINRYYRNSQILNFSINKLHFSDNLILNFEIENLSKLDFKICKIDINFHKITDKTLEKFTINSKPLLKKQFIIKDLIPTKTKKKINLEIKNFNINEYNITKNLKCFE